MEPLANKAILDEALRFQGTLSWTRSSWGEGPSSFTPFWVMRNYNQEVYKEIMGIEWGKGFSELGGEVLKILVDAVKRLLSMVFQDGLVVVFLENFSPSQESGVESRGNGASASTQEVGSDGVECKDPLSDKDFTKLAYFSRFLGMSVQRFEEEI